MHKSPKLVHINCSFDKPKKVFNAGDLITGSITVQPNYKLQFKSISYSICRVIKQYSRTIETTVVYTETFHIHSKTWKKGKNYRYPFQVSINDFPSYKGDLFHVEWYLRVDIVFTNAVRELAQKVAVRSLNIKRIVFPSINMSKEFRFKINTGQKRYQTGIAEQDFSHPTELKKYAVITAVCALAVVFNLESTIGLPFPVFEIMGCFYIISGIRHIPLGFGKFDDFTIEVLPSQAGQSYFPLKLKTNKQWTSIDSFGAYYMVNEKVANTGAKNVMQLAKRIQKEVNDDETTLLIPFPRNSMIPISFSEGNYRIIWEIVATVYLKNGKSKDYQIEFPVHLR